MFVSWREYSWKRANSLRCHLRHSYLKDGIKRESAQYLGSLSLKPSKPERECFWFQVKNHLDKLNLDTAERAKIEAAIAQKVPRGKNPHGDSDAPVEWYTPPEYVEMARRVLGKIDLDPATNDVAQAWIKAKTYYTIDDDGLKQSWHGRVWCNPPYGRKVNRWLEKAIASYQSGDVDAAILLLNHTGAAWYKSLKKEVSAICEADQRISFLDATGKKQSSPRYNNDFLYLGKDVELFEAIFQKLGEVRQLGHWPQAVRQMYSDFLAAQNQPKPNLLKLLSSKASKAFGSF